MPRLYPLADHTTQWFGDDYSSTSFKKVTRLVLHSTEGLGWPPYDGGAKAPNLTLRLAPQFHSVAWRQHFDILESSRALKNRPGGVETNTLECVQVEMIGTGSKETSQEWQADGHVPGRDYIEMWNPGEAVLSALTELGVWLHRYCGLPLDVWWSWPDMDTNSKGLIGRMTNTQWLEWDGGIVPHSAVAENDHRDPGAFPALELLARIERRLDPTEVESEDDMAALILVPSEATLPKGHVMTSAWIWTPAHGCRALANPFELHTALAAGVRKSECTLADLDSIIPKSVPRPLTHPRK